jgi:hypothetical protein
MDGLRFASTAQTRVSVPHEPLQETMSVSIGGAASTSPRTPLARSPTPHSSESPKRRSCRS